MENQVLSIEQMKELVALGLDMSNASMYWLKSIEPDMGWGLLIHKPSPEFTYIPTFTIQDIIDILPQYIEEKEIGRFDYELRVKKDEVVYESYDFLDKEGNPASLMYYSIYDVECNTILDCAFEMLKWCIKNKYIEYERTSIND